MSWELAEKIRKETMSDVTRRMAMSEAQVKATPSKAAMELVRVILSPLRLPITEEQYRDAAAVVDEKLADLLEKAEAVTDIHGEKHPTSCVHALAAALEPWKPK